MKTEQNPVAEQKTKMNETEAGEIAIAIVQYIHKKKVLEINPHVGKAELGERAKNWGFTVDQVMIFYIQVILPVSLRELTGYRDMQAHFDLPIVLGSNVKGKIALKFVIDDYCKIAGNDFFKRLKKVSEGTHISPDKLKEFYSKFVLPEYAKLLEKLELL